MNGENVRATHDADGWRLKIVATAHQQVLRECLITLVHTNTHTHTHTQTRCRKSFTKAANLLKRRMDRMQSKVEQ